MHHNSDVVKSNRLAVAFDPSEASSIPCVGLYRVYTRGRLEWFWTFCRFISFPQQSGLLPFQSYLESTLQSVFDNMSEEEVNEVLVVVFIAELDQEYVARIAAQVRNGSLIVFL